MKSITMFVAVVVLAAPALISTGCATVGRRTTDHRKVIGKYTLWDGMGPPKTDPNFAKFACVGTFTISNVDVNFEPGTSPACVSPMHQRTMGTLQFSEVESFRVTTRPELLIFKKGTNPPALRVTDWAGGKDFQVAVNRLENAYKSWKSQHPAAK